MIKAIIFMALIQLNEIGLGPDEAQYWTWSQALDWGYYSKPPGIAWQIWLGTQLFGQTEWGVRSFSVILTFFQSLTLYRLALTAGLLPQSAFWCSLLMAFSPLGLASSFFAITDVGFLLCWTGACLALAADLQKNEKVSFLKIGSWIAIGALFKWPIYLFWLFVICCTYWYFPNQNKQVFIVNFLKGLAFSLLGLLPSIYWNYTHDWATFRHVFATMQGGSGAYRAGGNPAEFIGSQALLLSPILFILLIFSLWHWLKQRKRLSPPLFFCGFATLSLLSAMTLISFYQKIQGNWISYAYPTGFVTLVWYAFEQLPKRALWAKIGIALSLVLTSVLLVVPSAHRFPTLAFLDINFQLNPFKQNLGWSLLANNLKEMGYDPDHHFLISDRYQTASLLNFYGPEQKRTYFLNIHGIRNNQFSYWPTFQDERPGQIGYFVWIENSPHFERDWDKKRMDYVNDLQQYFEHVNFVKLVPLLIQRNGIVKGALIFRCEKCKLVKLNHSLLY